MSKIKGEWVEAADAAWMRSRTAGDFRVTICAILSAVAPLIAEEARAAERDRCAKIAETCLDANAYDWTNERLVVELAEEIAAAIRQEPT